MEDQATLDEIAEAEEQLPGATAVLLMRDEGQVRFLVSTEAGGEGIDLQGAGCLEGAQLRGALAVRGSRVRSRTARPECSVPRAGGRPPSLRHRS